MQISRLLEAHEQILTFAREAAGKADEAGDDGTNDLLVSDLIRTNEMQVWFLSEHLVNAPVLDAHEQILKEAREGARKAGERGDAGTDDLLVSEVIRVNEMQVWFLSEHLVDTPLVQAR